MIQTSEYEAFPQRDFIEGGRLRASITDSDPIVYSETAWGAPIRPDHDRSQLLRRKTVDLRSEEGEVTNAGKKP
jgi:hypothetical protein